MGTVDKSLVETTNYSAEDAKFMEIAINLSVENIDTGGGPFGAVIVRDGEVIATGTNRVVPNSDPTAHAEVMAIRNACAKLGTFQLTGCTVYSSCEPCPMCLSALYWAGVSRICYGNTKDDAKAINFDDSFIYDQLELKYEDRSIKCEHFMRSDALRAFRKWDAKEDKVEYLYEVAQGQNIGGWKVFSWRYPEGGQLHKPSDGSYPYADYGRRTGKTFFLAQYQQDHNHRSEWNCPSHHGGSNIECARTFCKEDKAKHHAEHACVRGLLLYKGAFIHCLREQRLPYKE
jgi:tRNA(Arg) A34 adenosine deaminase TadA